jgi:hypothetical protein
MSWAVGIRLGESTSFGTRWVGGHKQLCVKRDETNNRYLTANHQSTDQWRNT